MAPANHGLMSDSHHDPRMDGRGMSWNATKSISPENQERRNAEEVTVRLAERQVHVSWFDGLILEEAAEVGAEKRRA